MKLRESPMLTTARRDSDNCPNASSSERFGDRLSPDALGELESLKVFSDHEANTVLFTEEQAPSQILFLLTGQVKLSMNSSAGRRMILGIANPGETLGLASALSDSTYDVTAETICPCRVASLCRNHFLEFLTRHPAAYKNVVRELSIDCARAREQVRTLGLAGHRTCETRAAPVGVVCRRPEDKGWYSVFVLAHARGKSANTSVPPARRSPESLANSDTGTCWNRVGRR